MQDQIIIATVVVVSLFAHAWLFLWVRFKVDEATIVKLLKQPEKELSHTTASISETTSISTSRVTKACKKSKTIQKVPNEDAWITVGSNSA